MIYDVIVVSASRPHLLLRTLTSLLRRVDTSPRRVIVHDDAVFKNQRELIDRVVYHACGVKESDRAFVIPHVVMHDDPPICHGPALVKLLAETTTDFVLYTQDDHEVIRDLPIARCLDVMYTHDLNHVRFNKRATMDYKDTWQGRWHKKEFRFPLVIDEALPPIAQYLTVSDHWYFQTSMCFSPSMRDLVSRASNHYGAAFAYRCEDKINAILDNAIETVTKKSSRDADVRAEHARTFIWGRIGEDRYVEHIGGAREDWARTRDEKDSER